MGRSGPLAVVDFIIHEVEGVSQVLERKLGIWSVVIISLSAMLGGPLFVLPAIAMYDLSSGNTMGTGAGIWLAYVLAALVVLPGALSKSELSTAMPTSGGSYVYIERTFGPMFGTIAGLGLWASFMLKSAFALIGFGAYLIVIEPVLPFELTEQSAKTAAIALLGLIVAINVSGVKKVKVVQAPITVTSVIFVVGLCIWALATQPVDWHAPIADTAFGGTWQNLAGTTAFVFISYAGVTKIAAIAEEVKRPGKTLPRGMLLSLLISTVLYGGVAYVLLAVLQPGDLIVNGQPSEAPIHILAVAVGGEWLGIITAIFAILMMVSMALAGTLASSRFPFAMSRDNLLPSALEIVNAKWETPHWSIILTGILMALAIFYLPVEDVAKLASGFKIMIFMVINACVIVLRRVSIAHNWYKPEYLSPLFPVMQLWGIFAGVILLIIMGEKAFIGAGVAIIAGLITYASYGRSRAHPKTTPWETVRLEMRDPDFAEIQRRHIIFHSADIHENGHLNLNEFRHAMRMLEYDLSDFALRNMFHEADVNEDGVIDIDQFLAQFITNEAEGE